MQAGGLKKLSKDFIIGAVGGAIGYPIGIFVYSRMIAFLETITETLLDSYCTKSHSNSIACTNWRYTSEIDHYDEFLAWRVDDRWNFAYDGIEHILSAFVGGLTSVGNSLVMPIFGNKFQALANTDLTSFAGASILSELRGRLMATGLVASLLQSSSWSVITQEGFNIASAIVTALVTAFVNSASLDAIGFSNFGNVVFNSASWAIATALTRYGSSSYDNYLRAKRLTES